MCLPVICSFYSITDNAAITLKGVVEFAAFLSETGVFAYLGLQVCCAVGGLTAAYLQTAKPPADFSCSCTAMAGSAPGAALAIT